MGLSASQGRLLLLTARRSDLEYRAQQISQKRLVLSQQLEEISLEYENATSNRQMKINLFNNSEVDKNGDAINRTMNLTYAALISGSYSHDPSVAGIQQSKYVKNGGWTSNNAYRLVSTDGAIVVSHISEIPTKFDVSEESSTSKASKVQNSKGENIPNLYKSTLIEKGDKDGTKLNGEPVDTYCVAAAADSELYQALGAADKKDVKIDMENGIVKIEDADKKIKYYNMADGKEAKLEDDKEYNCVTDAVLYASEDKIPASKTVEYGSSSRDLVQGNDGVWTLYEDEKHQKPIAKYIVDENLNLGMTDSAGTYAGPNYLQDCLRNGKYLLEQGRADNNNDEGFRWSSISWDTTSNISDSYYTEDDDAAKAKYDRLQTQIQAQDKKLELELDAIETQRSAVTTEVESVEKVINEDIEGTFNAFG